MIKYKARQGKAYKSIPDGLYALADAICTPHGDENAMLYSFSDIVPDATRTPHGDGNPLYFFYGSRTGKDTARTPHGDGNFTTYCFIRTST